RALESLRPPRTEEAIGYGMTARALRPETGHALAHVLEGRGRGEEAMAIFADLVRLRPAQGHRWGCYGRLLQERGERAGAETALGKAAAALREAIPLNPADALAHFDLGRALSGQGKLPEAIAEFREAIRLKPDFAVAHTNLGNALRRQGKAAEAIAEFREAIRLEPDDALVHNNLGRALSGQRQMAEALADI